MNTMWSARASIAALTRQLVCEKHRRKGCVKCWPRLQTPDPVPHTEGVDV